MTDTQRTSDQWALKRAMLFGAICLVVGVTAGWLIRGWENPTAAPAMQAAAQPAAAVPAAQTAPQDTARLKQQADTQAAPMLEQLKAQPDNAGLLTKLGNIYYDAQQYPTAIDYYQRALKSQPSDASVRTDMGTAYWYMGNADAAIAQFDQALTIAPTNANTLFNRGLVRWEGKGDGAGATADWKKLLATNPNYEAKDKVQQMLAQVEKHGAGR
ncbi:MAG TPA: tetratricopeptide repeat protein [Terracidiphilus sp.]|jgi:tetratricopeptide (TPR) repeat protein